MFLRQVYNHPLAQYAYVIGCQKTGEAIVIDPLREVTPYRAIAEAEGLRLTAVAETHIHADFVSGARELSADGQTKVYVSAEGGPDWQSEWALKLPNAHLLNHGDVFHVGNIKFEVLHTPGHTPEHVCYLVTDEGGGATQPMALITGDFLFVGDVGRPDLLEQAAGMAGTQEAGAKRLYHSLRTLENLPGYLQILPAHGAGSACGKSLGAVPSSTLGYEKLVNHALGLALNGTEEEFVSFILEGQPEPPLYFANMKRVNKTGPAVLGDVCTPPALPLADVLEHLSDPGLVVVDTRSNRHAFAAGHLPGSLFAPAQGDFPGFAGSFLMPEEKVVLVAESAAAAGELAWQLRDIGFDHVLGWLPASALDEVPEGGLAKLEATTFQDLPAGLQVLDARRRTEFEAGHLAGAINIAHTRLRARSGELPAGEPLAVHCQSGTRAAAASAWLRREGRKVLFINDSFQNAPANRLA